MHGIKLEPYEPTEADLTFTKNLVSMLKTGGLWGIPRCSLVYKKTGETTMKLIENAILEGAPPKIVEIIKRQQAEDHHNFKACCAKLGYTVDEEMLEKKS